MSAALADEALELRLERSDLAAHTWRFEMFLRGTETRVGEIDLRLDPEDPALVGHAGHIGYGVAPAHRGRRHALRACRLLAPLARSRGVTELWITTAPDNIGSCRTLDLLGARYVDTVEVPRGTQMHTLGILRVRRYRWDLS